MRIGIAAVALLALLALAAPASADVGVELLTTTARPGAIIRISVFAPASMPLYLVPASRASQPHRCRNGAICEPSSVGPPDHAPYARVRPLSRRGVVVRVRVPVALRSGRYRAVLYCESCYRGVSGSLIVSGNALLVR
jgi:hypothetical protein